MSFNMRAFFYGSIQMGSLFILIYVLFLKVSTNGCEADEKYISIVGRKHVFLRYDFTIKYDPGTNVFSEFLFPDTLGLVFLNTFCLRCPEILLCPQLG